MRLEVVPTPGDFTICIRILQTRDAVEKLLADLRVFNKCNLLKFRRAEGHSSNLIAVQRGHHFKGLFIECMNLETKHQTIPHRKERSSRKRAIHRIADPS